MFSYNNIPIVIEGRPHQFDYEYLEEPAESRVCTITSEGRVLVVDKDFTVIKTDMPGNWVDAAIEKLRVLLAGNQTPLP